MNVWVFVGITVGALALMGLAYYAIELLGRTMERRNRTAAQASLDRYWDNNKADLLKDLICPNCDLHFDAPDKAYFECPNCGYLLTQEWVKNYFHRKLKEEWENSFSGKFYRIAPEAKSDRNKGALEG